MLEGSDSKALRNNLIHLTATQRKVFDSIPEGQWFTLAELRMKILGNYYSDSTMKVYIFHIRKKLRGTDWVLEGTGKGVYRLTHVVQTPY
jgi:hypothetical protein